VTSDLRGTQSKCAFLEKITFSGFMRFDCEALSARDKQQKTTVRSAPWRKDTANDRYRSTGALREGINLSFRIVLINRTIECASFLQDFLTMAVYIRKETMSRQHFRWGMAFSRTIIGGPCTRTSRIGRRFFRFFTEIPCDPRFPCTTRGFCQAFLRRPHPMGLRTPTGRFDCGSACAPHTSTGASQREGGVRSVHIYSSRTAKRFFSVL
jgi:hypothetical protein